jgi:hypothetical protein
MPDEVEGDCAVRADKPEIDELERAEGVDFDEEASTPELVEPITDEPGMADRPDRCDLPIPLVEETESVVTDVAVLLEAVRPEVEVEFGPALVDDEELWR